MTGEQTFIGNLLGGGSVHVCGAVHSSLVCKKAIVSIFRWGNRGPETSGGLSNLKHLVSA